MSLLRYRLPAFFSALTFLLCELISRPYAEMGIADDWSYVHTSQLLARTGHIHYVGWAEAIVGWQFYLAAAFIKLFSFSFTTARLSTLLVAVITVFVMQRTMVRLGLNETSATVGTLTLALSPLFMVLSATMMTDVPGFFATLICLYSCIRAIQASTNRAAGLWLCFAIAANAICGTSRPTAWLGLFVTVPSALWLLRKRRTVFIQGTVALLAGFCFVVLVMRWFHHQLYYINSYTSLSNFAPHLARLVAYQSIQSVQMCGFLLLPVLIAFLLQARRWPRRVAIACGLVAVLFFCFAQRVEVLRFLMSPFWGEFINLSSVYDGNSVATQPPILIGRYPHILIDMLVLLSLLSTAITVFLLRRSQPSRAIQPVLWMQALAPLALATTLLLVLRIKIAGLVHERYFFTLLFCLLLLLLLYYQDRIRQPLPRLCMVLVALWGVYGIVSTHNMFSLYRARVAIGNEVLASGVSPSSIDFGWEQDGWYELQQSAYVNNINIATPNTFHPATHHSGDSCHAPGTLGSYLHLAPRYGIAFTPNLCDGPAPFAPVPYSVWLIHQQPTLYIFKYPPPWKSEIDYGVPAPPPPPSS